MTPSTSQKGLHKFIVIVNYYCDMQAKNYHMLQNLTRLTSKNIKFKQTYVEQKVFYKVKLRVENNNLSYYLQFNKKFDIHNYARKF